MTSIVANSLQNSVSSMLQEEEASLISESLSHLVCVLCDSLKELWMKEARDSAYGMLSLSYQVPKD